MSLRELRPKFAQPVTPARALPTQPVTPARALPTQPVTPARALPRQPVTPARALPVPAWQPDGRRRLGGVVGLAVAVAAAAWTAFGSAGGAYLLDTARGPREAWTLGPLHGTAQIGPAGLSAALIAMLAGYLVALTNATRLPRRAVWGAIAAANLLFALAPTLVSTDVFGYLSYARLGVLRGLNPYLAAPIAAPLDPLLPYVYWQHATTPYGPLFTAASYPLALVGPAAGFWLLKALGGLAGVGLAVIVARRAAAQGRDHLRAALLVGLNPVILFYAVGGAHNDLLATLAVTLGLSVALAGRERAGAAAIVAAASIKATAGLALPFLILGARRPRRALAAGAASVTLLALATLLTFGPHVFDQLGRIASGHRFDIAFSGPDLTGRLLGTGIDGPVRALCTGAFVALAAAALGRVRRGADWISMAGWATLALLASIASLAPWYLVWLMPFAALGRSRRLVYAALLLTGFTLATHLPLLGGEPWLTPAR